MKIYNDMTSKMLVRIEALGFAFSIYWNWEVSYTKYSFDSYMYWWLNLGWLSLQRLRKL